MTSAPLQLNNLHHAHEKIPITLPLYMRWPYSLSLVVRMTVFICDPIMIMLAILATGDLPCLSVVLSQHARLQS